MKNPFTTVKILPNYAKGFTFLWELSKSFYEKMPWIFQVEEAPSDKGPWNAISPELTNIFVFSEIDKKRLINKDLVLFFRITLTTAENTYISNVRTPYGDLNRHDYLIVRDIMRREVLQQKMLAGTQAIMWNRATWGPRCTHCRDPITGSRIKNDCEYCYGVGRIPGYHGPYAIYATFSPTKRNTEQKPNGNGTVQLYSWTVRMIGYPYAKDKNIIIDTESDKRYIVDGVSNLTEIRRIPVVQSLTVKELPVSDPAYKLGKQND